MVDRLTEFCADCRLRTGSSTNARERQGLSRGFVHLGLVGVIGEIAPYLDVAADPAAHLDKGLHDDCAVVADLAQRRRRSRARAAGPCRGRAGCSRRCGSGRAAGRRRGSPAPKLSSSMFIWKVSRITLTFGLPTSRTKATPSSAVLSTWFSNRLSTSRQRSTPRFAAKSARLEMPSRPRARSPALSTGLE